jgi:hypothetical protein
MREYFQRGDLVEEVDEIGYKKSYGNLALIRYGSSVSRRKYGS